MPSTEPRQSASPTAEPLEKPEPAVIPSPEPTITPTPDAVQEPAVTPEPFQRSSGLASDGRFDAGAIFVGDSLSYRFVHYLREQGKYGAARCMAICGMSLSMFFDAEQAPLANGLSVGNASVCSEEFEGLSYAEAFTVAGNSIQAVYFMLGTNQSMEVTQDSYLPVLRHILDACPSATVYFQTVPYSTNADYEGVNESIRQSWETLETEVPGRVVLLDSGSAFPRPALLQDGLHYSDLACAAWYQYLLDQLSGLA